MAPDEAAADEDASDSGAPQPPRITLSEPAAERLQSAVDGHSNPVTGIRLAIVGRGPEGFQHSLALIEEGEKQEDDITVEASGITMFVESRNAETLDARQGGRSLLKPFFQDGSDLVALHRDTGELAWRRSVDFSKIQHHLYLAYAKGKLVSVGTRNEKTGNANTVRYDVAVFSARDGEPIWAKSQDQGQSAGGSHGEQDHHPAIVGDLILQEPYAYDLQTGERRKDWRFARRGHGCGTVSASASAFFFRAGNPTMCDLTTGKNTRINAVSRPGCWINIIPAGGLLLIPEASSGCTCNFPIQSSMAFAPVEKN